MKFWITCPKCKQKFGVSPAMVMKYFERILGEHKNELEGIKEVLESAQAQLTEKKEKKESEPVKESDRCPFCQSENLEHGTAEGLAKPKSYTACKDCGKLICWG